jgi:hypothetical protein
MTVLFAGMLFFTPPAHAALCATMPNNEVLAHLKESSKETIRFVGLLGTGAAPIPMEITISDTGTWTILMLTPEGVCFLAVGADWQTVEAKPPGVEN